MIYSKYTLAELATIKYGKDKKKVISKEGHIPIYGTGGFMGYATKALYDKPSVLIGRKGTIGKVKYVEHPFWTVDTLFYTVVNTEIVLPRYLYYAMSLIDLDKYNEGTTIPSLRTETLNKLVLDIPSLEEQQKIISYIRPIEEKIEINQKINKNLQEQAQAIYQNIFINKASPSWPIGHLSDLIDIKYGKDHKKLADGKYPVYGSGGIMRYVDHFLYDKESVLIPRKGTLNNIIYVDQPFWSVDTMFYTKMKTPDSAKFIYHFIKSRDLASMNAGSAVPSMTTSILNAIELRIPSQKALNVFENTVSSMYVMMNENTVQLQKLTKLRDTLLPKLMSGELNVTNIKF